MPRGLNELRLTCKLCYDPKHRHLPSGVPYAYTLVIWNTRLLISGKWEDHTNMANLEFYGRWADSFAKYCRKGDKIFVQGYLANLIHGNEKKKKGMKLIGERYIWLGDLNKPSHQSDSSESG